MNNENREDFDINNYEGYTGHNDKPNYKKGARRKILGTILYAGSICLKSAYLLSEPSRSKKTPSPRKNQDEPERIGRHRPFLKKINDMVDEGLLSKEHSNGCYYVAIAKRNEEYKDIAREYFTQELLDFYTRYGSEQVKKLRAGNYINKRATKDMTPEQKRIISSENHRAQTEAKRASRMSETVMFIDGVGVDYLPGGYDFPTLLDEPVTVKTDPKENKPLLNAFYVYSEIASLLPEEFYFKNQSSRATGFLFSIGGNYIVYNFSDRFIEITSGPESRIIDVLKTRILPQRKMEDVKGQIVLYKNDRVLNDMLNPGNNLHAKWFTNLTANCMHTYLLPLDKNGQKLAHLMTVRSWEERLKHLIATGFKSEIKDTDNYAFPNDGIMNYKYKSGAICKRYVFFFVVPDIIRFRDYRNAVLALNDRSHYEIFCFDYQEDFVKECMEDKAVVTALPFEDIYQAFVNTYLRNARE